MKPQRREERRESGEEKKKFTTDFTDYTEKEGNEKFSPK
jgi:hypothetical protein